MNPIGPPYTSCPALPAVGTVVIHEPYYTPAPGEVPSWLKPAPPLNPSDCPRCKGKNVARDGEGHDDSACYDCGFQWCEEDRRAHEDSDRQAKRKQQLAELDKKWREANPEKSDAAGRI